MKTTAEALVDYLGRGWTVIPTIKNSKKPAVAWAKYNEQQPTDKEMAEWFANGNGMAVLTGPSNLLVVDVDAYKGSVDLEGFLEKYPTNLRAETPNGGIHLFYDATGLDLKTGQGDLGENIDTRAKGGYVLISPTTIDGRSYNWIEFGDPAPVPQDFIERLSRNHADTLPETIAIPVVDSTDLITAIVQDGFTPGQHNEQLRRLAQVFYRAMYGSSKALKDDVYWRILQALDERDPTPQSLTNSFKPTVSSAYKYEEGRLLGNIPAAVPKLELMSYMDVSIKWANYEKRFLIDEWLPEASVLYMAAPPESWKTWIMLDAAVSVALGGNAPFLGQYPTTPHEDYNKGLPVIIFQQEDHPGEIARRIDLIMNEKLNKRGLNAIHFTSKHQDPLFVFENPLAIPLYIHEHAELNFDDPEMIDLLRRRIKETGAKLVCIDPLYSVASSENYFMGFTTAMHEIKKIRNETGCAFLFLHHTTKSSSSKSGRGGAFGSVLLDGSMEGAWIINKTDDARVEVQRSGKFFEDRNTYTLSFDVNSGYEKINGKRVYNPALQQYEVSIQNGRALVGDDAVLEAVRASDGISITELEKALDKPRSSLYRSLSSLVEQGMIEKDGKVWR